MIEEIFCTICQMAIDDDGFDYCLVQDELVHNFCYEMEMCKLNIRLYDEGLTRRCTQLASVNCEEMFDEGGEKNYVDPTFQWLEEHDEEMDSFRHAFAAHLLEFIVKSREMTEESFNAYAAFVDQFESKVFMLYFDFAVFDRHKQWIVENVRIIDWSNISEIESVFYSIVDGTRTNPEIRYIFEDVLHDLALIQLKANVDDKFMTFEEEINQEVDQREEEDSSENMFLLFPIEKVILTCSICLEDFNDGDEVIRLPCNHVFHAIDLIQWGECSNLCPCCRRPAT